MEVEPPWEGEIVKRTIGLVVLLGVVLGVVAVAGASSDANDRVLRSELVGNVAGTPPIFGVSPAGAPWVVASSDEIGRASCRERV